jgi:hypothetical protein
MSDAGSYSSYSDLDTQLTHAAVQITAGGDNNQKAEKAFSYDLVTDENNLENDEIAELVATRFQVVLQDRSFGANFGDDVADNPGFVVTDYGFGINVDLDDLSNKSGIEQVPVDDPDVAESVARGFKNNKSEPGLLYDARQLVNGTFGNATDGLGGPSGAMVIDRGFYHWEDMFGRGPFADANDEFNQVMEIKRSNFSADVKIEWSVQNYWNVSTVEGARPTFAPPGRGD